MLKLINNGLTLARLDTFWQMVVTGIIILMAVGLDLVRQSKNPESVRKILDGIAAVIAFLALMTPGAISLRAKVAILEHNASVALRDSSEQLAAGQNARLLSPEQITEFQTSASSNLGATLLLLVLVVAAAYVVLRTSRKISFILAAVIVAMIVPILMMGYQIIAPFLILGAAALLGSAFVHALHARARALDVNA